MGRMALIIVLALSVGVGIISYSFNTWKSETVEAVGGFDRYATARDIAHTAINIALRHLDKNDSLFIKSQSMSVNAMGGTATVTFQYDSAGLIPAMLKDTMDMTCNAKFLDSTRTMTLQLQRSPVPFPTLGAAIGIRAKPVNFSVSGHPTVDGRNHDATGNTLVGSGDKPAVSVLSSADSANVKNAGATLVGSPTQVSIDTTTQDPLPYLPTYENAADYTFNSPGTYGGGQNWGSSSSPAIVYCNAGDDTTFSIKFAGNVTGYGILVVRGNIQFNGNFTFYGLVIVDGFNTAVTFNAAGTPMIVGGVIVAGNAGANVSLKGTGNNSKVLYSSAALNNAKYINKLQVYRVMRWYE